jgi:Methyltransferase domain
MNIHDIYGVFQNYFRTRRLDRFRTIFPAALCRTIIDLGGSRYQWDRLKYQSRVTILNVDLGERTSNYNPNYEYVFGDARNVQAGPGSYDLAFSNSVIEHVGEWPDQVRFAREIRRLGKSVYCETPNRWFFMEPHLITPFIHWLPRRWQSYTVLRYFTVWGLITKPDREYVEKFAWPTRLLCKKEFASLFPDCDILVERFLLMPKAFIAVRRCE